MTSNQKAANLTHSQLNDMGVLLLRKNCFRQSFQMFSEALKAADSSEFEHHVEGPVDPAEMLENRANFSYERFPSGLLSSCCVASLASLTTTSELLKVLEQSNNSNSSVNETTLIFQMGACRSDCRTGYKKEVWKKISLATITYNYGIAHQTFAKALCQTKRPSTLLAINHHTKAKDLFHTVECLLDSVPSVVALNEKLKQGLKKETLLSRIQTLRMVNLLALHAEVVGTKGEPAVVRILTSLHSDNMAVLQTKKARGNCNPRYPNKTLWNPAA